MNYRVEHRDQLWSRKGIFKPLMYTRHGINGSSYLPGPPIGQTLVDVCIWYAQSFPLGLALDSWAAPIMVL